MTSEAAKLPGTLWFVAGERGHARGEQELVRVAGGKVTTELADVGAMVFPSRWALPDGRLVGIASRGDGSAGAEQLVLIGPATEVVRIGDAVTQVRNPAVDPSGKWIVYEGNTDGHSDLYRLDLDAAKTTRLTNDPQGNFAPVVLGAGDVAFASSRDGDSEIYRMPVTGGEATRLTAFHRDDWQPAASPDGKSIAFVSDREGRPRVFVMAADGTRQRRLTTRKQEDLDELEPVWSPDGKRIAYVTEGVGKLHVWIVDVATGEERVVTPVGARDAEPAFSPDGAWIAVSRTTERDTDLWAVPVAGGTPVQITSGAAVERLPRWRD